MDPRLTLARTIVGIIGNVISFGLFLSPVPTVVGFFKKKSTEDFHPYNYLAGILNCCFWIFYGSPAVHPHSTLIWTINSVGLVLYVCYLGAFVCYAPKKMRYKAAIVFAADALIMAAIATPVLILVDTKKERTLIVGIICVVFNIILYASPMTVLTKVVRDKSVEFLPFWVSFAGLANGSCWTAYGLMPFDVNLLIGNGLGAILSAIQLVLHFIYGNPCAELKKPFKFVSQCLQYRCGGGRRSTGEKTVQLENVVVDPIVN